MRSRHFIVCVAVVSTIASAPLFAQERSDIVFVAGAGNNIEATDDDPVAPLQSSGKADEINSIADKAADPVVQDKVAYMVEHMTNAMMRLPVGHFAAAIEDARPGTVKKHIRRDATVADLAGRDADTLPNELGDRSRQAMGMMSGFARAFAQMMPEIEKMGHDMEASFEQVKAETRKIHE
jgi:hypothetical protein